MKGHGAKFERKREEAVIALLTHRTLEDAARSIDVNTQTLFRWTKIPEFQEALRDARRAAYGQAMARLQQGSGAAASVLLKVMVDPNTPASTRVRAADSVLNHTAKAIEIEDIQVRLALLEAASSSDDHRTGRG